MDFPCRVSKTWGYEIWFANSAIVGYCGKELGMQQFWRCSLHCHPIKDETFFVIQGEFLIEWSEEDDGSNLQQIKLGVGSCFHVPAGMWHRMTAICAHNSFSRLIEASSFHSDDDVERLEPSGKHPDEGLCRRLSSLPATSPVEHSPEAVPSCPGLCRRQPGDTQPSSEPHTSSIPPVERPDALQQ